jgi:hypothetical protein
MLADQMGEDFGVRFRVELMPGLGKPFFYSVEILDHAIVNDGDASRLVEVRVGILVRGRAVGGPSGVANAELTGRRLGLEDTAEAFVNPAFFLACLKRRVIQHAHSGAVVTTVLKSAQPFQEDGSRLLSADVTYDTAHDFKAVPLSVWAMDCNFSAARFRRCAMSVPFRSSSARSGLAAYKDVRPFARKGFPAEPRSAREPQRD